MAKREAIFTERELDVMHVLWDRKTGTVAEVRELIEDELAYTTVLTILRTLEQKGFVRHELEGRSYRYHPAVSRDEAREGHLHRILVNVFGGSPSALVEQLVTGRKLPDAELKKIRKLLKV